MLRLRQFFALAGLAALEAIRQPILLLLTVTCVLATTLTPLTLMHNFGEDGKLARDGGLAFHLVFGLFVAAYAAGSSLSREMRGGTASAVLSKPVSREVFFVAKFAGIAAVVVAFSLCATIATLMSERIAEHFVVTSRQAGFSTDWAAGRLLLAAPAAACLIAGLLNYAARRPFQSTAYGLLIVCLLAAFWVSGFFDRSGHWAPLDFGVQWRIAPVSLLVTLALVMLAALAVSLATRLDTVPTLSVCGGVFLLGLVSDHLFGGPGAGPAARLLHGVIPNWQHFWLCDALDGGGSVTWSYVLKAAGYAAVSAAACLLFGIVSFRHAEVK